MAKREPPSHRSILFVPPTAKLPGSTPSETPACNQRPRVTRRVALRHIAGATGALFVSLLADKVNAEDKDNKADDPPCKNCSGSGIVSCELCSGTGFWRALGNTNSRQLYKGVVCPECEGSGELRCPVCLGTGEGRIRGLLRRRAVPPGPGRILQSNV